MPLETITIAKKNVPAFIWAVEAMAINEVSITNRYDFSGSTQFEINYSNGQKAFALGVFYERRKKELAEGKEVSNANN